MIFSIKFGIMYLNISSLCIKKAYELIAEYCEGCTHIEGLFLADQCTYYKEMIERGECTHRKDWRD